MRSSCRFRTQTAGQTENFLPNARHTALGEIPAPDPGPIARGVCPMCTSGPRPSAAHGAPIPSLRLRGVAACGETSAKNRRARAHPDAPSSRRRALARRRARGRGRPRCRRVAGGRRARAPREPGPEGRRRGRGPTGTGRRPACGLGRGRRPPRRDRVRRGRREDRPPPHRDRRRVGRLGRSGP